MFKNKQASYLRKLSNWQATSSEATDTAVPSWVWKQSATSGIWKQPATSGIWKQTAAADEGRHATR